MRRTILGAILLVGGLSLLAAPFSGIAGPCWDTLAPEDMATVRGGVICMYNDYPPCEGHPDDCEGCWDHDGNSGTAEHCVRAAERRYKPDSSLPGFPFCKGSSVEEGNEDCMDTTFTTVCYKTWVCPTECEWATPGYYWFCPDGSNVSDEAIHDTYDVDYESPPCDPLES